MKSVLINNVHEEGSGGGGYWTHQIIKSISSFCEVDLVNRVHPRRAENNSELTTETGTYDENKEYDYFIDISHFDANICDKAKKNIKVCFFPKIEHSSKEYDEIVTLSEYSRKFIKTYWGRDSLICRPYSKDLKAGVTKIDKSIVSVGNMFYEDDGHSKNQHMLIEAFKQLPIGYTLKIIGNPVNQTYANHLKSVAPEGVTIHESISDVEKEKILSESQFFWHAIGFNRVDPSQTEHFGIAPEEGIKSGCLTYVHNSGGAKEFCQSWNTFDELLQMTINKTPNKDNISFGSKEESESFWRRVIV